VKWEYKVVKIDFLDRKFSTRGRLETESVASLLNQFGGEGWELVSILQGHPDALSELNVFLKRPIH